MEVLYSRQVAGDHSHRKGAVVETMTGLTLGIADWVTSTTYSHLSTDAITAAKRAILDTLGVSLAGSTQPVGRIVTEYARGVGASGKAGIIAGGFKTDPVNAAFANGVLAHSIDFDDTSQLSPGRLGHPSSGVMPAVLAAAEKIGASGESAITGLVVGIEIYAVAGAGPGTPYFHNAGVYNALAAASAAASIMGLDSQRARMALAIAASHAAGLSKNTGTMTKPYHAGNAASGGLRGALLAQTGFSGDPNILEGPQGYIQAFHGPVPINIGETLSGLGNPFHIISPGLAVKKYPTCFLNHRGLDALIPILIENDIRPDAVAEVVLTVPHRGWLDLAEPDSGLRSKFSIQYNLAEVIMSRKIVIESFDDDHSMRPEVRHLMRQIKLEVDTSIPSAYDQASNPVRIRLKDGRVFKGQVDTPHGNWDQPLTLNELLDKFRDNAERVMSRSACNQLVDQVMRLEDINDLSKLSDIFTFGDLALN